MNLFTEMLTYPFMIRAFLVGIVITIVLLYWVPVWY